jgi:predicted AlkP superfamily pyrophosphatase or phosphodiesterase
MKRIAVLNVVGLSNGIIGDPTPRMREFATRGGRAIIAPVFPALTCPAQSTYLTGMPPRTHGIVGNGWYNRDLAEVQFWKQSNHLVAGRKLWEELRRRDDSVTCAKLFWWHNMYSSADYSVTPRPVYCADGRKVFDIYTWPSSIRTAIQRDLGPFPFPCFWGPAAGVKSAAGPADAASRWIAEAAKWIDRQYRPMLNLIYLPHLDYNLQRLGPYERGSAGPAQAAAAEVFAARRSHPSIHPDLRAIDSIVGDLIDYFRGREVQVVLLSEYGLSNVEEPIHLNRVFRQERWLTVKDELGLEILDCGASRVFAVADHQIAHIYLNDRSLENRVRSLVEAIPGVASVLGAPEKAAAAIDHARAGDLIAVAKEEAWFTYYYWLEDRRAPDFARTVDIHRKPGYDPVELFLDPQTRALKWKIVWRLLQKKLGFRTLMDVIPLEASLVKGSHGCRPADRADWPVFITDRPELLDQPALEPTSVFDVLLQHAL